jgi:hypothetical protein
MSEPDGGRWFRFLINPSLPVLKKRRASVAAGCLCNRRNVAPVSRPAIARASTPAFVHEQFRNHTAKELVEKLDRLNKDHAKHSACLQTWQDPGS